MSYAESFLVEYSKSDRATCKSCQRGIGKGDVRIGHKTKSNHHDGMDVAWNHVKCKVNRVKDLEALKGWEVLRWEDQKDIIDKYFPGSCKLDAATQTKRQKYLEGIYEIRDELEGLINLPAAKLIAEANGDKPGSSIDLHHRNIADWMLLGRTGPCPTCKSLAVYYNSIQYKCYGYMSEYTRCDWEGDSIARYKMVVPDGLKANIAKFFQSFKYSKDYPKTVYTKPSSDDEAEEEEEEDEEEADVEAEDDDDSAATSTTTTSTSDGAEEDEIPVGKELYGMIVVVAGSAKTLDPAPNAIKALVEKHGGQLVEQTAKATLMITSVEEVTKASSKKVQDAIKTIPIFPVTWLLDLCNRTGQGINLRKRSISKTWAIKPSSLNDDHEMCTVKYHLPCLPKAKATTTTTTTTSTAATKKRKTEELAPVDPKKKPKPGSDILKVDPKAGSGYEIYVDHDPEYGYTAHSVMLNLVDVSHGSNKFYKIQLCTKGKQYGVFLSWGRVGHEMGNKFETYRSLSPAIDFFKERFTYFTDVKWEDRLRFKKRPGKYFMTQLDDGWEDEETEKWESATFKKNKTEDGSQDLSLSVSSTGLPQRTQELVKLMFDPEMMKKQLESMSVDVKKMPLGKIKKSQIMSGYEILSEIQNLLSQPKPSQIHLQDCSNKFFTLIPHVFNADSPPIIDTPAALKKKMDLIEALLDIEIANQLKKQTENVEGNIIENQYKTLKTNFNPLDKQSELYQLLVNYTQNSHDSNYFRFKLDVQDIWSVDREGETSRFKPWEANENRLLLWHGSRLTNWVGIISQGLRIAPPEAPKTGYRFGKGIYFADCVSKSASYCFTTRENPTALMILCEVALGNMNELKNDQYMEKAPSGKHSTKALGMAAPDAKENKKIDNDITIPVGKIKNTGLSTSCSHNEFIVYDINQVKIRYILKVNVTN
ncbi:polyADP-ribosyltransferase [Heterostelium album PN500]|uniref:Poly [ADP-ribose] polymerase n=1 Tax=Heterostelium pallidum (strain ATCC 26659 / Pp 5 / PN500) TaxID=670386 RepID=D3B7N1_HETP5|nr:polyADP-ribosyltransferase [Heterostelium album PN500]EFA82774.1 polyADP-ribosyltransferase [Heterostelium album PN500]|eukprot:XP_020434891.1 polyADP-ribosyltransferase [Heterostelium album PN500]